MAHRAVKIANLCMAMKAFEEGAKRGERKHTCNHVCTLVCSCIRYTD